jgi:hypothetical protein
VRTFTVTSAAPARVAWRLIARPAEWPAWSPHVAGAWGLGEPEVHAGALGAARLLGVVPVPARITAKRAGRGWDWSVGPGLVRMAHRVEPRGRDGCEIAIDLTAPPVLEQVVAASYGPLIRRALERLAREAEARAA